MRIDVGDCPSYKFIVGIDTHIDGRPNFPMVFGNYVLGCHHDSGFLNDARACEAMALNIDCPHEVVFGDIVSWNLLHVVLVTVQQLSARQANIYGIVLNDDADWEAMLIGHNRIHIFLKFTQKISVSLKVKEVAHVGYALSGQRIIQIHSIIDVWNRDLWGFTWRWVSSLVCLIQADRGVF